MTKYCYSNNNLFDVDKDSPLLTADKAQSFYTIVAKLLFLAKRGCPDILTAIAFLTTCVTKPSRDNNEKLDRVLRYLRHTNHLILTLESDGSGDIKWMADASFAVHRDMKSHTGGGGTMGKGYFYATSTRQKLNAKSSTEAKLVAADDLLTSLLWTRNFLLAQGYKVEHCTLMQDNLSAMQLEQNGRASSGKRTRHINICYFYITSKIDDGSIRVLHQPTDMMVADLLTKPLQGSTFRRFRQLLLNE